MRYIRIFWHAQNFLCHDLFSDLKHFCELLDASNFQFIYALAHLLPSPSLFCFERNNLTSAHSFVLLVIIDS